jgi:hypothetical protein
VRSSKTPDRRKPRPAASSSRFLDHRSQNLSFQAQISEQHFQPGGFHRPVFQPLRLARVHPIVLRPSYVNRHLADSMICQVPATLMSFQDSDDLLFVKLNSRTNVTYINSLEPVGFHKIDRENRRSLLRALWRENELGGSRAYECNFGVSRLVQPTSRHLLGG